MPTPIEVYLGQHNLDGFLFIGDSICDADMYYLSGFLAGDRFALLVQEKTTLLVSSMEAGRAEKESRADRSLATSSYKMMEKLKSGKDAEEAYVQVLVEFLRDHGIKRLGLPFRFPVGIYRHLIPDFDVRILESPASRWREVKRQEELDAIASAQRACEKAMHQAVHLIRSSEPRGDMLYREGRPLEAEQVRSAIEASLLQDGCEAQDTIVAGGPAGADPHVRGTGPLPAHAPIVIDIFPRSKSLRYFADMTRTVLKGEAEPELLEIYEAVRLAQDRGLQAIRAGVSGEEVHAQVCQVFLDMGYPEREGRGFTHSTGHGVGLDVHEKPSLSETGGALHTNNVVTVEPGLYYPEVGGVRLEDLVVVKENGCENLTHFERRLLL